jgi:hypothetical protein
MKSWVAGHLTGGIGNRLFQHAAAAGLAEKWKIPLIFSLPECEPTNHGPFDNIFKLFPTVPILDSSPSVHRLAEAQGGAFVYRPFPSSPPADFTSVDGWRQTELYFPSNGMHPDFVSALPKERRMKLEEQFGLQTTDQRLNTSFLHIRLGDYKILPHHQIDLHSYYSQAVQHIPKGKRVFLFSDELEKYGTYLQGLLRQMGLEVELANIPDELDSLYIMSLCWGGAVVANSTFSWWGAYFAKQSTPSPSSFVAIYPAKWGNGLPEARDVVPSWGIRIQNT